MLNGEESPESPGSRAGTSSEYRVLGKRKPSSSSTNDETVRPSVPRSSKMSHPAFGRHRSDGRSGELHSLSKRQRSESRKRSIVNEDQLRQAENVVMDDEDGDIFSGGQVLNESRPSENETNESREQLGCKIAAHCLGSNLSSEDLSSHLASCIQLNTANKINKNNAFSLQLIDYMCVLMARNDKTINDFPTMSCSLDASSKIYACRVDCVHSGIMEIATGLSSITEKAKLNRNRMDDSDEHSGGEEEVQRRRRRRKRMILVSVVTPLSISNLSKGTNLLGSGWEDYELFGDECNNNNNNDLFMNDVTSIEIDETPDKDDSNQNSCNEEEVNVEANDLEIVSCQEGPESSNVSCSESGDELGIVERAQCSRKKSRLDALNFVNSRALQAPEESIYSYFDTDLLPDFWAGPEYWKPKFRRLKPSRRVKEEEEEVMSRIRKKTPKKDVLCFENLRNFDLARDSARSKLDRRVMARWLDSDMTKPVRHDNKIQDLFRSFLRKTLFFKPYLTREEDADEVKVETEFTDDGGIIFDELYEDNIHTLTENDLAPRNVAAQEPMSPSECHDEVEDQLCFEVNSNKENDYLRPRSYIAQNNSQLTYETVPKKLDMKMLKSTVWTLLDGDRENSISNNHGTQLTSNIYTQLQDHLPDDVWKDTSPALVFLALLHLANEKTLKLKATESMTDVIVEKG
ncbi:condensin complex subunit 2 [Nilaparvata lugens]|uniref:condensin complex subunit 2 n=1 Tax=Nilaparvata lugens TaxID=108931 RepID=UPI00193C9996|nr:condensin complex subunit 2 [Nilaparvata lugens]